MKKNNLALLILTLTAAIFTGCAAMFPATENRTPVVSEIVTTNRVAEIVSDASGAPVATNFTEQITRSFQTNFITNTSYAVNPQISGGIVTAQTVNGVIPHPWQGLVNIGLALLASILGIVAKFKSDKAAIVPAIIAGVEAAGNAETKKAIQLSATAYGVENRLNDLVRGL